MMKHAVMRVLTSVLLVLSCIHCSFPYSPEVLDYFLRTIEYLASVEPGSFSCVFYDVTAKNRFDNILNEILQSPRISHVVKYVLNGTFHDGLVKLPMQPSILIIYPGNDVQYLEQSDTMWNIYNVTRLFHPSTKVLAFVDYSNQALVKSLLNQLYNVKFAYSVFVDSRTLNVIYCYGEICSEWPRLPQPMYLFEIGRRWQKSRNITYVTMPDTPFAWNLHWLNETAQYLHTEIVEDQHGCKGNGSGFYWCPGKNIDIILNSMWITPTTPRDFMHFCTSVPIIWKVAVPRDRPLNVAELMLMPFTWHVWILLMAILVSAEIAKLLYPEQFKNEPFLLAVCGFERHDLHRAGRLEKIIFFSLIVLMFFISNAFETKIVSLMTSRPSIQRIKTMAELFQSNIKFRYDLEAHPQYKKYSYFKEMIVQGDEVKITDTYPSVGALANSDFIDLLTETAFDYERMQPFYVVLDHEIFEGPECYYASWRSLLQRPFRFMHSALVEAGLVNLWKRQWSSKMRSICNGRRPRMDIRHKRDLKFGDMQPAWLALAIGLCTSLSVFLGEHCKKSFHLRYRQP